jgi:signal transduction histidine kinase
VRPLDRVGSIKRKLGLVIVAAVSATVIVVEVGERAGWPTLPVAIGAVAVALAVVQVLAHGMTAPLRAMARAATRLAAGDDHRPVTATSRDEVGDLARAFNSMAAQLAETDRLRRDLIANASHELRTPVAAIRAVLENLVDGIEEPDAATLAGLLEQVERLQRLLDQLLDLSRLEAGVVALDTRHVDLHDTVAAAVRTVTAAHPTRDVAVQLAAHRLVAEVDDDRLQQVLVNLLTNAHRHAPPGSTVVVEGARRDDGAVELAVVDDGPGIPGVDLERIFDRFHRSDPARASGAGGSGLGLAISREIVALHGGRLTVDPDHRPGCRVLVSLPASPPGNPPTNTGELERAR